MANLNDMTRDDLNAHATSVGVADPESFANKAELIAAIEATGVDASEPAGEEAPASVEAQITAHLDDPRRNPLPEGARINFGDAVPFQVVTES